MDTTTTAPAADASALQLLQAEIAKLAVLVRDYSKLDAGGASDTDLGARWGRIGGRMQAILQFERELMLPRLDDARLRRSAEAQADDVLQHLEQLAGQSAQDEGVSAPEMQALSEHFQAHAQLLTGGVWTALSDCERQPMGEELAEWRARWLQDEAAD